MPARADAAIGFGIGRCALLWLLLMVCGGADALTLQRGVNLSRWFEASAGAPVEAAELQMLRRAGFDHVRIPVDPTALGWSPERGARMDAAPRLRAAVDAALAAGLDAIVDMHPNEATKQAIENDSAVADAYLAMWTRLAGEFKSLPTQRVAFELLNEPGFYGIAGGFRWSRYQQRLVRAVRAVAPERVLIISGRKGGSLEGLVELDPLDDPHLIYSFHYYLPYIFTHQGASWMQGDRWTTAGHWRSVRYPAPLARKQLPRTDGKVEFERARDELTEYFQDGWNREHIAAQWQPLRDWAAKHRVRVHCGEFGVIREGVDPVSRYRWIADVRALAEAEGWGWSVWNYADDFGIADNSNTDGRPRGALEPAALRALGLNPEAR
ncbi:glycoside hydrolase family 5 protein [Pseudomonas sp. CGJS7]|uniref:glycoside hydrolase family 5 protein n=1 Tax=Pseudomonas sp. CGJS7 TaxID=3109348 RepID=UPI00300BC213